ncbi:MarR family winged helix-turn-helix transcriptional regulator [Rubrobacter marinus]|nr:MarR family transcriptional regulator [Rubrobacter marinus]
MAKSDTVKKVLRLQDELIHYRAVLDAGPWLDLNMSTPQLKALLLISEEDAIRMRELARKLGGSFSNATVLVDRLVERGLVERMMEPQDRRVVLVRATEDGRLLIEQLVTSWRSLSEPLLERLSTEDLETVRKALDILVGAAQAREKEDARQEG